MTNETFRTSLFEYFDGLRHILTTNEGDWIIKGFIDVYKNIYTISIDTKVVSKIIELMLFPILSRFADEHGYKMILSQHQNHYPDISFITPDDTKIALDLKSSYRIDGNIVNGFTLGAFTGYFRQRQSAKNITFPYQQFSSHYVLGVIYSRNQAALDERRVYTLDDLTSILSVARDFTFLLQEKWRIASDRPGSGNTKNIGSVLSVDALINGSGVFSTYGEAVFDDYWMNYMTDDMARAIDSVVPYRTFKEYQAWRRPLTTLQDP